MADDNYLTQIAIPKDAAQWLRENASYYRLGLAGVVRILLLNALDAGWTLPEVFDWSGREPSKIQIGIPLDIVQRIGGSADLEAAKEATREACRHVIQIAYERSRQSSAQTLSFFPSLLSSSAA